MKLTTTRVFNTNAARLWPLLYQSKMDNSKSCYFLFGLPKPLECRLQGAEGVGQTRECISDKGIIQQTILEWEPHKKLAFELRHTTLYFAPCVESIIETFEITPLGPNKSSITRHTDFKVKKLVKPFIAIPMCIGLKQIHKYVFKNWKRLAEEKSIA